MSTKPTLADARFATDVTYRTSPSAGLRDTGFVPNTLAVPNYLNEELYQFYLWAQYLSDGDIDLDDVTANSLTLDSFLTVNGSATFNDPVVIDDASFGLTVLGPIGAGDIAANSLVTTADVEAANLRFTDDQALTIPAAASFVATTSARHPLDAGGGWRVLESFTDPIVYPIVLPAGAVLTSWFLYGQKSAGDTLSARIYSQSLTTFTMAAADGGGSAGASTSLNTAFTLNPASQPTLTFSLAAQYVLVVTTGSSFVNGDKLGNLVVTWHMP